MGNDPLQDEQDALDREDGKIPAGEAEAAAEESGEAAAAASVEERAANGEHLEDTGPPPMGGDVQLSMNVGKMLDPASRKVTEGTISLSAAEVPVDGLFRPDQRYAFVVMGVPGNVVTVPVRDPKSTAIPRRVIGVKLRQNIAVDAVRRADDPEVLAELFGQLLDANPEAAGALIDQLRELVAERLSVAA